MLTAALLGLLAVLLAAVAPRLMARLEALRQAPGPALLAWQSTGVSAVLSALLVAPAALLWLAGDDPGSGQGWSDRFAAHPTALGIALAVTALMAVSLLVSGHRVGTGLRALRRRHRDLVDLLDPPQQRTQDRQRQDSDVSELRAVSVRLLEHPGVAVYCLPGLRNRVVLSRGAVQTLGAPELTAVLAHERAHLRARHDLVLEFFTVLHRAVPAPLRSAAALAEVHLLVEALADRAAIRHTGPVPLARALVALTGARHPEATLGAGVSAAQARVRLALVTDAGRPRPGLTVATLAFSAAVLLAPWLLLAQAL